jgi:hypothetical protein
MEIAFTTRMNSNEYCKINILLNSSFLVVFAKSGINVIETGINQYNIIPYVHEKKLILKYMIFNEINHTL